MSLISDAFSILLPHACLICSAKAADDERVLASLPRGFHICADCLSRLVPYEHDRRFLPCLSEPYKEDPHPGLILYMPFPYDDFFARVVHGIKFGGKRESADFMGRILGKLMSGDKITADAVVPVPLSSVRLSERGFNQAEEIGKGLSEVTSIPLLKNVLRRTRDTKRQAELKEDISRSENVRGAFDVSPDWDVTGMKILLLDDVATTGNTMHEAACALYEKGASQVVCAALCGNRNARNSDPF